MLCLCFVNKLFPCQDLRAELFLSEFHEWPADVLFSPGGATIL